MSIEAMKLALEALKEAETYDDGAEKWNRHSEAKEALRQAIKEAAFEGLAETSREIEPVAWAVGRKVATCNEDFADLWRSKGEEVTPLYTAPMSTKPENIDTKTERVDGVDIEPVAWMTNSEQDVTAEFLFSHVQTPMHKIPLYEAPPKREWQSLTDEDVGLFKRDYQSGEIGSFVALTIAIEQRLKEKNNG